MNKKISYAPNPSSESLAGSGRPPMQIEILADIFEKFDPGGVKAHEMAIRIRQEAKTNEESTISDRPNESSEDLSSLDPPHFRWKEFNEHIKKVDPDGKIAMELAKKYSGNKK